MTVEELIEKLKEYPAFYEVKCDAGAMEFRLDPDPLARCVRIPMDVDTAICDDCDMREQACMRSGCSERV